MPLVSPPANSLFYRLGRMRPGNDVGWNAVHKLDAFALGERFESQLDPSILGPLLPIRWGIKLAHHALHACVTVSR